MKTTLLATLLLALCGCGQQSNAPKPITTGLEVHQPLENQKSRFTVTLMAEFGDNLAYGNKRGIYLITDTKTKREFVGVSGIGISSLGEHQEFAGVDEDGIPQFETEKDER